MFGCALIVLFVIDLEHHISAERHHAARASSSGSCSACSPPGWLASLIGILVGGGTLR